MAAIEKSNVALLRSKEERDFRLIVMVSFAFFLVVCIIARLLPPQWRPFPPGPNGRRSVIEEARVAANTTIPFAFMR
ncbi:MULTISPECIES: hypothetical protein [Hyphomicrobiales]|uniref:Uncharacterized protein n=2 Tax=Hyphomicrobiales TaxID=356 RepID=A0A1G5P1K1_AFIMA|nr:MULTISPECIES: hypothetical protein [Hyphomicrobiales]MBK1624324.1 hypothetical protein [Afifella marina DSM 2698]MBK1628056.1 hypothetical protein [Afifella marina]MBK5918251.1 hypothetical protein [Afifella marina]MCF1502619.1 hypothetical protein [Afifella sp. H1R]MDQ0327407.1 hypothetical protein [Rhodopseudomonas julia]